MDISIVFGSAVIAAVITGLISIYTRNRDNRLKYITEERRKWRKEIRVCAEKLRGATYDQTLKICDKLKVRINAYGNNNVCNRFSHDAHIWTLIHTIERKKWEKNELLDMQRGLSEYLSLLLKNDWERSKREVLGEKRNWQELILWGVTALAYLAVFILDYFVNGKEWKSNGEIAAAGCVILNIVIIVCFYVVKKQLEELYTIMFVGHVRSVQRDKKRKNDNKFVGAGTINWVVAILIPLAYVGFLFAVTKYLFDSPSNIIWLGILISGLFCTAAAFLLANNLNFIINNYYNYETAVNKIEEKLEKYISLEEIA